MHHAPFGSPFGLQHPPTFAPHCMFELMLQVNLHVHPRSVRAGLYLVPRSFS